MSLFAFPIVGRPGLGNMLLPWARAEVFARRNGARIIKPAWNTVRLGPYLRREPQKRYYMGFFNALDHVHGLAKLACLARAARLSESDLATAAMATGFDQGKPCVVCFKGLGDYFAPLLDEHDFVRRRLWQMTRPALRTSGDLYGGRFIAMHIRRGDLTRAGLTQRQLASAELYTPTDWFVAMARALRQRSEFDAMPLVLFTDGSADEVSDVLRVDKVRLHSSGPAIADLWTLAHASLLFATGHSTFSMWASYLGGMPTVYAPGKIQQSVQAGRPGAIEIELAAHDALPAGLHGSIAARRT